MDETCDSGLGDDACPAELECTGVGSWRGTYACRIPCDSYHDCPSAGTSGGYSCDGGYCFFNEASLPR